MENDLFEIGVKSLPTGQELKGEYQKEGVLRMLKCEIDGQKGGIQADDMGLGKTNMSIFVIKAHNKGPTLIVCEVSCLDQWKQKLIEFGNIKPVVITTSSKFHIDKSAEVVLTTYSIFQQQKTNGSSLYDIQWWRIVLDEAHKIRNTQTIIFKSLNKLKSTIRWCLTATPIQNSAKDMVALTSWIGMKNTSVIRRTIEQESKRCKELDIIPLDSQVVMLDFKYDEEIELYQSLLDQGRYQMQNNKKQGILGFLNKCRQSCFSPKIVTLNEKKRKFNQDEVCVFDDSRKLTDVNEFDMDDEEESCSTKIDYVIDYLMSEKNKNDKFVVFCKWHNVMNELMKTFKRYQIGAEMYDGSMSRESRNAAIYNFKETSIRGLIIQIDAGGQGLNLQEAKHVINTTPDWNPCLEAQAVARVWRRGQTQNVTYLRLIIKNTIEEYCINTQCKKLDIINNVLLDDSMKSRLGSRKQEFTEMNLEDIFWKAYRMRGNIKKLIPE